MRRPQLMVVVVVMISVCSGCGGASTGIGDTAARSLEPKIAQVRAAAEARQPDVAKAKLDELRREVEALQRQGELTEAEAARILGAVGGVEDNLTLITSTTTEPRPATTLPRRATTTQPGKQDQDEKPQDEQEEKNDEKRDGENQKD